MNEIDVNRYDYLRTKRYVVHEEHEQFIRPETLAEMREYEAIEFYSRERIRELSQKGLIHQELKQRIDELLRCRASGRFSTSLLISSCVLIGRSLSHDSLWMKAISWAYAKSDRRC